MVNHNINVPKLLTFTTGIQTARVWCSFFFSRAVRAVRHLFYRQPDESREARSNRLQISFCSLYLWHYFIVLVY